jgi:hypothetical protein
MSLSTNLQEKIAHLDPSLPAVLNPNLPFKKHTATIHITADLTAVDYKVQNILYKAAFEIDGFDSEEYTLRLSEIGKFLGWKSTSIRDIKPSLERLRAGAIRWNIFDQDNKNKDAWVSVGETGFISHFAVSLSADSVRFSVSPLLRRMLKSPNIYALIDLSMQGKIKGKYELIYYEYFLEECFRRKTPELITRWYSINDIRMMLNVPKDVWAEARYFNRFCVRDPIKNLNACDVDIKVEIHEVQRINRSVVAYRFLVKYTGKETFGDQLELGISLRSSRVDEFHYDLQDELSLYFDAKTVEQIINDCKERFPDFYDSFIRANIEYSKTKSSVGQIKNIPGYILAAINGDFAKYVQQRETILEQEEAFRRQQVLAEEQLRQRHAEDAKFIEIENMFNALSSEEIDSIRLKCIEKNPKYNSLPELSRRAMMIKVFEESLSSK